MRKKARLRLSAALILGAACASASELAWEELRPRAQIDAGHLVRGSYYGTELQFQPLNRNTVILEQSAAFGDRWEFDAGFKGIIWWPFNVNANEPHQRTIRVDPRLSQAAARYRLSEGPDSSFLRFGFFPYKYNRDARNLGEYLHRSGTYPGIVRTSDGFHLLDHAAYDAYGAQLRLAHGPLRQDFTLFAEPTTFPTGDFSPGYEIAARAGFLEIGAGASWYRLLSFAPSRLQPKADENAYLKVDSAGARIFEGPFGAASAALKNRLAAGDSGLQVQTSYWTQRGLKFMARASLDFGFLLPESRRGPEDLRLFAEAAVLGWENQPYYYDNRWERVPVMAGIHLPAFRLLDLLSLQAEHYGSPFYDSKFFNETGYPRWGQSFGRPGFDSVGTHRDDWKWSLYARKTVNRLLRVHVQVANDHLRLPLFNYNPSDMALTRTPGNWYYLMRLECGI